jgi:hypothetical protein
MSRIQINTYESNPEWNLLEIKQNWSTWYVSSFPGNNDVEIQCYTDQNGSEHLILNQDELKQFIAFLQTKVK